MITSFSPAAEGKVGDTITINGAGFDPTPANNSVTFSGVTASVTGSTATTLTVVVPSGAETGPVVVTVDSRSSRAKTFRVLLATGFLSISSVAIDSMASNHVFFTDRSTNDTLYEIMPSGSVVNRCSLNEATGLPVDSSGNLYFGLGLTGGISGQLNRYLPASTTCQTYVATTKVIGETTASVIGAALTEVGGLNVYTADNENARIKRTDPTLAVSRLTSEPLTLSNPTGMAISSSGGSLYFTATNSIRSLPIPGGAVNSTLVRNLVGSPKGMAVTTDDKLILTRASVATNAVSWYDPASSSNPFWDLATGFPSPPVLQGVALGSDGGGAFLVVAESTRVYRLPKPSVVLSDAADAALPAKIVADFTPGTTDCLGANVITLKAKFNPSSLIPDTTPRQLVTWSAVDPDDPSDDAAVDTNGSAGGDNIQALGSYNQWEAVGGFALTGALTAANVQTEVVGGISEVKFHLSCQPGDNYRFVAQVTTPVYGAIQETSDTLTVWRKLHIESDSMGPGGPFDPDDAALDDVPEALYTLFANAYRPAYVEVALPPDTGQNTPDVRFQNNVDTNSALAIANQGRLGRATSSTAGYWVVYLQGSYEGNILHDNDPDTEDGIDFGFTNAAVPNSGGRYSLTFVEDIRDATAEAGIDTEYENTAIGLHESGHQFGLGDATGCVMNQIPILTPVFCGGQIRAIRSIPAPSTNDTP